MSIINSITSFIKNHLKTIEAQPEIQIVFSPSFTSEDYKQALREMWEEILKELEVNPQAVLNREWTNYEWLWERIEKIKVKDDNVVLELIGPKYPMPGSRFIKPEEPKMSQVEYSDQNITQMLPQFLNHLSNATREKKRAVFISVSAAVRGEVTDDELVRKVGDDVMQRLVLRSLIKEPEKAQ